MNITIETGVFTFIAFIVAIAVALITLDWFFRDGDEATDSAEEFADRMGRPYDSPEFTKFGMWIIVSGGCGLLCFKLLPFLWHKLLALF